MTKASKALLELELKGRPLFQTSFPLKPKHDPKPKNPEQIAFLHVDADLYSSTHDL